MSELPIGWTKCLLSEISLITMGQAPASEHCNEDGNGIPFFQGKAEFRKLYPQIRRYCSSPTKMAQRGDILLSIRAPVGPTNLAPDTCCIGRGLAAIRGEGGIENSFLIHLFKSIEPWLSEQGTGTTFKAISGDFLRSIDILLPPLAEQTRIAQKLDELLAQVDTLKARIDGIPALLKRFRQSVLAAAVSGRLTEEWRKQNFFGKALQLNPKAKQLSEDEISSAEEILGGPLPSFWNKFALEQLVDPNRGIPYGIVQTGIPADQGVPTVRCGDVKELYIDTKNLKIVSPEIEADYKRTRLKGGEVLLAIRGSVGNVGVASNLLKGCNISREVAMIPTLDLLSPFYLACLLQSPLGQVLLIGKVRGVAQKGINLADVRRLPVALPPYEEQTEIVRRVEQLFAFADQLEVKVKTAQVRIDQLTQSILAKAFRGELVPQDPSDEPASVLLERIKAQRAAEPKAKRGGKKFLRPDVKI